MAQYFYGAYGRRIVPHDFPEIVCLCGSTRFYKQFQEWNARLQLDGKIVLSIAADFKSDATLLKEGFLTDETKAALDALHKRKIDLADSIFVLNVGGYIGDSTRSEIEYAIGTGKPITWLEEENDDRQRA